MAEINLCIDIGNTSTKAGVFADGQLIEWIKPFTEVHLKKYLHLGAKVLVARSGRDENVEQHLRPHHYLTHTMPLPLAIAYDTPHTLGRDRIATAAGAASIDPEGSWLVIDLGTCLTIDWVECGVFQGGLISPGVQMRYKAMHEYTAALPLVEADDLAAFPGKSTVHAMQVGVSQSIRLEIEGYIRQLNQSVSTLKIVDCSSIPLHFGKEVKNEIFARPKLVVEGLNHILAYNEEK